MDIDTIVCADAFDLLRTLPDGSVDMILADLPYEITQNRWDFIIPLFPLWVEFRRVVKPHSIIALTANQPFTSDLVVSNRTMFRYEWLWTKTRASGFLDANNRPMRQHETVLIFSQRTPIYYPQFNNGKPYRAFTASKSTNYGNFQQIPTINTGFRYPTTLLKFSNETGLTPTQKPVDLFRYLIRTYTLPGELVVDPVVGSGTTAVAAKAEGRRFICGDQSPEYVAIATARLTHSGKELKAVLEGKPHTIPMFE